MYKRITDNKKYSIFDVFENPDKSMLYRLIVNKTVKDICSNADILTVPTNFLKTKSLQNDDCILKQEFESISTGNVIGFIGKSEEFLYICSRFTSSRDEKDYSDSNDYFLQYMLSKVYHLNVLNLDTYSDKDANYLNYILLFPIYLESALSKGVFRQYRKIHYNDRRFKGKLDVDRQIKENMPFMGNIAYVTREYTEDNYVTQLIRHTREHIRSSGHYCGNNKWVRKVEEITEFSYRNQDKNRVMNDNIDFPVTNDLYKEYYQLQKICLSILNYKKIGHSRTRCSDRISGILFDVAWLWEEYLGIILSDQYIVSDNRNRKAGISPFINGDKRKCLFPDFRSRHDTPEQYSRVVLDAKYKPFDSKSIDRNDLHQVISYAYLLKAEVAGIIYPSQDCKKECEERNLQGYGAKFVTYPFYIPQNAKNYTEFCEKMTLSEEKLREVSQKWLNET